MFLAPATAGSDGGSPGEVPPSGISSYGYSSFSGSDTYGAEYADLLAKFEHDHTPTDVGIAWFLLVVSSGLLVVMTGVMFLLIKNRHVFEIRARSACLVMLLGASTMTALAMNMVGQSVVIFNALPNLYTFFMLYFFILVCGSCCYGSRTIRLAVLFSTGTRRVVPWLASERNHVCMCLVLGAGSLGFPLYVMYDVGDGPFAELLFAERAGVLLWRVSIASQAMVLSLYPLVWKTDDIFNISRELRVVIVLTFSTTLIGHFGDNHSSEDVARWVNTRIMGFISATVIFFLSLGLPIRQLVFDPLESSDPRVSRALAKRRQGRLGPESTTTPCCTSSAGSEFSGVNTLALWTYEKVEAMPSVSVAFHEFSRKALCQESIFFLKDVTNSGNKDAIVGVYEAGQLAFYGLPSRERRYCSLQGV
ncbi:expressed unknown protein [Ectocarpus siliculosus]|uniref:Uncharacterized protein n=1 Tax=Ectocarpus siliculosus TaxID=2880 RepID=D8LEK8_ECTSI|nr:expressed unknown protein [Ectocarpus siliculosus]|eukprot:CBN78571.1 expressed unknown protein [Ectocarpus siliculosus]